MFVERTVLRSFLLYNFLRLILYGVLGRPIATLAVAFSFGMVMSNPTGFDALKSKYIVYIVCCSVVTVLFAVVVYFLPESPYFLMRKGKDNMANKSMKKLRGKKDASEELAVIKVLSLKDFYLIDTIF